MRISRQSTAGTLESSDVFVTVSPAENISIEVQSVVLAQFGDDIRSSILDEINKIGLSGVHVSVSDRGALDCTIRARVETAIRRAL